MNDAIDIGITVLESDSLLRSLGRVRVREKERERKREKKSLVYI